MANIVLKDVNGNNIYPEIDASTLSGTITENNEKFVIGGDVYSALNDKANLTDIPEIDDYTLTENSTGKWKVSRPLPELENANVKHRFLRLDKDNNDELSYGWYVMPGQDYNYDKTTTTRHTITAEEKTAGKFKYILLLDDYKRKASAVKLMGNIYGFRYMESSSSTTGKPVTNSHVSHIDIYLADNYGDILNGEQIIRRINSSEFALSDRNMNDSTTDSTSQALFQFSHFGSCTSSMLENNQIAVTLVVEINLSSPTSLVAGNVFELFVSWVEF